MQAGRRCVGGGRAIAQCACCVRPGRRAVNYRFIPVMFTFPMLPPLSALPAAHPLLDDLNPLPRLLMGPGPINADPRVLRAMSAQLLGQFDPQFRLMMKETMALYRLVFDTQNDWTLLLDGTARSAIEMVMMSAIEPDDKVLVFSFGRFGQLGFESLGAVAGHPQSACCQAAAPRRPRAARLCLPGHRPANCPAPAASTARVCRCA